jgi:hypothetical protein
MNEFIVWENKIKQFGIDIVFINFITNVCGFYVITQLGQKKRYLREALKM